MTALEQLNGYLRQLEKRLRFFAASRGAAITTVAALILTVLLVWISNQYKFADGIVLPMRVLLFAGVAFAVVFALALPVSRLNRRRITRLAESQVPEFKEGLLTVTERPDSANPFTELVAEDALRIAQQHGREEFVASKWLWGSVATALVAVVGLLWMITSAPGYWGYGASLLWTGTAHAGSRPLYDISVQPGNKTLRRKSDQVISAELLGFSSRDVRLHAKYRGSLKWEEIPMQAQPGGNGFQFLFAGLSDSLDYYVQAGDAKSKSFTLGVKDMPVVKRVRVGLHFPSGIGLRDVVLDPGGDIRAVEGSQAEISVLTDRPLEHGVLVLENGSKIALQQGEGNWLKAPLPIKKDGSYHVAAIDNGETVRISDDYFIEAKKDEPPTVKIVRPGKDPRVTPIEEMPVTVEATDDFGVNGLELHYSVNGGKEQTTPLLRDKGLKEATGKTTMYLENLKLVPGDVISYYATARDATKTARSDIAFAQAEPFDFKFKQSQQAGGGGGGGGGGDESNQISERQKEIIAATWNELRDPKKERAALAENARFLSDLEGKLGEQSKTLAERMGSRELASASPQFAQFSKAMNDASNQMGQAVTELKPGKWQDALQPEQKALQSLLHAEAVFRDIQVSFGQQAGGGGGGMNGEQRDLARMFDLELDTSKNQYETGQKASPSMGGNQQQQINEALQRLKDLARRQQELAEQHAQQQQNFQQRWEEEQLRREAEQLRQQLQQLAQNQQGQQGQQGQQSPSGQQSQSGQQQQGQSGQSGQRGQSGQQQARGQQQAQSGQSGSQSAAAMREAMNALQRAEDQMRQAVTNHDGTARQRAAQQLAQAQNMLKQMMDQQVGNSVSDMAQKARELANSQKQLANRVKQQYGAEGINTARNQQSPGESGQGSVEMPEMSGPGFAGYGWRRRFYQEDSGRPATEQEKQLAAENEKLAQQVQQLQRQIEQQAQGMAENQPEATNKLRRALSDAEQEELALRMQKNSEWMRQGFGSQTWPMEDSITAGMDQLSRQLQDAQQAVKDGKAGDQNPADEKMAKALAQVQSLREQLENQGQQGRAGQNGERQTGQQGQQQQGQSGQQSGQGQQSDQGQQSGQGQQGQSGQAGQEGGRGQQQARNGTWSAHGGGGPMIGGGGGDVRDAIEELQALRGELGRNDRRLSGSVNDAIGWLRHMDGQAGLLDERVNQDAVASLERLEVELSRRMGQQDGGAARTGTPETAPEKYRDAVAEYFRRLSK